MSDPGIPAAQRLTLTGVSSDSSHSQAHTRDPPLRHPADTNDDDNLEDCTHRPNTPLKSSTHRTGAPFENLEMLKHQLHRELSSGYRDLQDLLPSSIYAAIPGVSNDDVNAYLKKTPLFDSRNNRWILPRDKNPKRRFPEKALYEPFQKIIASILKHFHIDSVQVENTHNRMMLHLEDYLSVYVDQQGVECKNKTAPDLCIMGSGQMFRPLRKGESTSYFQCGSPIEIKTTRLGTSLQDLTLQVAVYARQCFSHQPNRFYTSAVIATEKLFYLLVFDRTGTLRVIKVDLHGEAATFVRVIIGISSFNSRQLSSFDPVIKYLNCKSYHLEMNLENFISVDSDERRSYQIVLNEKPFFRKALRGRATRCWLGTIVSNKFHVIVKESWRSEDRKPEWELLRKVMGLDGVGQMVAYSDDNTTSISKFRSIIIQGFAFSPGEMDRIFTRVILEAYGPAIHYFQTPLQALYIFRDAVAGHRALWMAKILHRDISIHNVLIGNEHAKTGNRGVLIDLDMAIDITNYVPSKDPRTGTRAFQSIMTLLPEARIVPQDHRDDLESFYYILLWICALFIAPRKLVQTSALQDLEAPDDTACAGFKRHSMERTRHLMSRWFVDTVFLSLLMKLAKILDGWIKTKSDTLNKRHPIFPTVEQIWQDIGPGDHDIFLTAIDEAITTLLNDEHDFGHSKGVLDLTLSLQEVQVVDLDDESVAAPGINNQASFSHVDTSNKRDRSSSGDH